MRIAGERAFVLHARPWRETSLLVDLLTAGHGRVAAVARGVQGPKRQAQRAALETWQHLELDADARGELWTLRRWEPVDLAPRPAGDAALAGFYVHELLLRLLPRADAVPEVHARYATLRREIGELEPLAWCLRRFERDVLEALGLGLAWGETVDGQGLDPAARYRIDPEQGLWRDRTHAADSLRGSALVALAEDRCPSPGELAELRRGLRAVLAHHLGGKPLKAWGLMAEVGRLASSGRGGEGLVDAGEQGGDR
jgi:DNA repair protein RecO (recombination protein O)